MIDRIVKSTIDMISTANGQLSVHELSNQKNLNRRILSRKFSKTVGLTLIYFESKDCTTEENLVEKAGGKIIRPKMSIGEFGFVSILMDIDGNTIGLHSRE